MADDLSSAQQALSAIQQDIASSQKMAELFMTAAANSTGAVAKNLDKVAAVYDSLAKNSTKRLELEKQLDEMEKQRLKTVKEIEKLESDGTDESKAKLELKKKERDEQTQLILKQRASLDITEKQVDTQKKVITEINNSSGAIGKFAKAIAAINLEKVAETISKYTKTTRDILDISIESGSFLGMSGEYQKDIKALGEATLEYGANLTGTEVALGRLGMKGEEVDAAFKAFSKITPFENQASQLRELTIATGELSKELGVSLGDATDFVITSQQKFGRTASESALTLYQVKESTARFNQELGRTVIVGRDVTKMLFDLAKESTSGTQDQQLLAKTITSNMAALQAQGANYQQAQTAAKDYIEAMTTKAPSWSRILAGRELLDQTKLVGGKMSSSMVESLEKARPGLAAEVQKIQEAGYSPYQKAQMIQKLLESTSVGLNAMSKTIDKFLFDKSGNIKANAAQVVQAVYGITDPLEQDRFLQQQKMQMDAQKGQQRYLDLVKKTHSADVDARRQAAQDLEKEFQLKVGKDDEYIDYLAKNQDDLHDKIMGNVDKQNAAKLKAADDQKKTDEKALEDKLRKEITNAKSPEVKAALQKRLDETTGEGLKKVSEKASKEQEAAKLANTGQGILNFLHSPTGLFLEGLLALASFGKSLPSLLRYVTGAGGGGAAEGVAAAGGKELVKKAGTSALLSGGAIGLAVGGVGLSALTIAMRRTEIEQEKKAQAVHENVIDHIQERIDLLKQSAGNEEKIAKLQSVINESEADYAQQQSETKTGAFDKYKVLLGMTPSTGIMATPVAPTPPASLPTSAGAATPGAPAGVGGGGGSGGTTTTGEIVQGAQGYDYRITTSHVIPLSKIQGANMAHAARMSGGGT